MQIDRKDKQDFIFFRVLGAIGIAAVLLVLTAMFRVPSAYHWVSMMLGWMIGSLTIGFAWYLREADISERIKSYEASGSRY